MITPKTKPPNKMLNEIQLEIKLSKPWAKHNPNSVSRPNDNATTNRE